jgi:nucleoside-diphosphate-sugar epimerase
MTSQNGRVMVTGASGQIGTELLNSLCRRHGPENVIAADIQPLSALAPACPFEILDVTKADHVEAVIKKHGVETVYHLAAILSAKGEKNPALAWTVNMDGTYNILEAGRKLGLTRIFIPSSIAAFGPDTPRVRTPQDTILRPKTMYGLTKVAGELLADYYVDRFGVDVRGCRFPGIISHGALPGGGTTDYAVAIYYEAVKYGRYTCFLREDTRLPMMYMPDCLKSIFDLMDADFKDLRHHSNFNVTAMSFTPSEQAAEIRKHIPGFEIVSKPDFRQAIADSWPESLDDSAARTEWKWAPDHDLASMTADMLKVLTNRLAEGRLGY